MLPPACREVVCWLAPAGRELGVAPDLQRGDDQQHPQPEHEHGGEDDPTLLLVPGHLAEGEGEGERDGQDRARSRTRLVIPLGFSNGWAELAPKKPPPFWPPSLIASWLATGPPGIVWVWPATVVTVVDVWKLSMTPWLIRTMAATKARGSRTRTLTRIRSTQKLPRVRVRRRMQAPDEGHRHRRAGRRGHEVVKRQAGHLGQVAHDPVAVGLPVGIGQKADGRVERQLRRHTLVVVRVQEQMPWRRSWAYRTSTDTRLKASRDRA